MGVNLLVRFNFMTTFLYHLKALAMYFQNDIFFHNHNMCTNELISNGTPKFSMYNFLFRSNYSHSKLDRDGCFSGSIE